MITVWNITHRVQLMHLQGSAGILTTPREQINKRVTITAIRIDLETGRVANTTKAIAQALGFGPGILIKQCSPTAYSS